MTRWVVGVSIALVIGCGGGMRERLRTRASADLHCPADQIVAADTGLGGWQVHGCGQRATYVCSRGVCAMQDSAGARTVASAHREIGAWACEFSSATAGDVERITSQLTTDAPALSACASTQVVLALNRGSSTFSILAVDQDRGCASQALVGVMEMTSSPTVRCTRDR